MLILLTQLQTALHALECGVVSWLNKRTADSDSENAIGEALVLLHELRGPMETAHRRHRRAC